MTQKRTSRLVQFGAVLTCAGMLAACGNSNPSASDSSTSTEPPVSVQATQTTDTTVVANPVTQVSTPETSPTQYLTDFQAARTNGVDTVTFTFKDTVPGYTAEYITPPLTNDGEGAPVAISGDAIVKLVFAAGSTVDLTGGVNYTYSGPKRISPTGTMNVSEVAQVSDFEARLLFGIGVKAKVPFTPTVSGNRLILTF